MVLKKTSLEREDINTEVTNLNGPMRRRDRTAAILKSMMMDRVPHCGTGRSGDGRKSCLTLVLATQPIPTGSE